jgi:hypothetical protein
MVSKRTSYSYNFNVGYIGCSSSSWAVFFGLTGAAPTGARSVCPAGRPRPLFCRPASSPGQSRGPPSPPHPSVLAFSARSRADPIAIPGTRRTASTSRKTEAFARRQRRGEMAGSQQGMGTGPRFRSATTAVVRDQTWPSKRKGLVEVFGRRRPSVYSGSTPEIEIARARSKETATHSSEGRALPCWRNESIWICSRHP